MKKLSLHLLFTINKLRNTQTHTIELRSANSFTIYICTSHPVIVSAPIVWWLVFWVRSIHSLYTVPHNGMPLCEACIIMRINCSISCCCAKLSNSIWRVQNTRFNRIPHWKLQNKLKHFLGYPHYCSIHVYGTIYIFQYTVENVVSDIKVLRHLWTITPFLNHTKRSETVKVGVAKTRSQNSAWRLDLYV